MNQIRFPVISKIEGNSGIEDSNSEGGFYGMFSF
jgi:hypothetical protein